MANINNKETFSRKATNTADILPLGVVAVEYRVEAEKNDNLPHNVFTIANQNTSCTLYIFKDDFSDPDTPDYICFPNQQVAVTLDDGVSFTTLFIKNTHAANTIAAKELKYRIGTIKEV